MSVTRLKVFSWSLFMICLFCFSDVKMKSYFLPAQVLLWSLPFLRNSECSLGDRSVRFQQCLFSKNHLCREEEHVHLQYPAVLPVHLKFLGWTCMDELKYLCMHDVTHERLEAELPVLQYYGKVKCFFEFIWEYYRLGKVIIHEHFHLIPNENTK